MVTRAETRKFKMKAPRKAWLKKIAHSSAQAKASTRDPGAISRRDISAAALPGRVRRKSPDRRDRTPSSAISNGKGALTFRRRKGWCRKSCKANCSEGERDGGT